MHSHGFVRVAACTPAVAVGDPGFNAAETKTLKAALRRLYVNMEALER